MTDTVSILLIIGSAVVGPIDSLYVGIRLTGDHKAALAEYNRKLHECQLRVDIPEDRRIVLMGSSHPKGVGGGAWPESWGPLPCMHVRDRDYPEGIPSGFESVAETCARAMKDIGAQINPDWEKYPMYVGKWYLGTLPTKYSDTTVRCIPAPRGLR